MCGRGSLAGSMHMTESKVRVLAIAPNWLGDVAMCTPALRALRTRYPDALFSVAGKAGACQLLDGLPWIDHLIPVPSQLSLGKCSPSAGAFEPTPGI